MENLEFLENKSWDFDKIGKGHGKCQVFQLKGHGFLRCGQGKVK